MTGLTDDRYPSENCVIWATVLLWRVPMITCRILVPCTVFGLLQTGCSYYTAQSLVATNVRATAEEPVTRGPTRVEAQVCGNRLFSIPFGPDPTMDALVRALEEQTADSVGLEDIRIDHLFINYLFIFWQDCVHATASPLLAVAPPREPKRRARAAPPTPEAPPPRQAPPADSDPSAEPSADPFAQ